MGFFFFLRSVATRLNDSAVQVLRSARERERKRRKKNTVGFLPLFDCTIVFEYSAATVCLTIVFSTKSR
jgi:hypothetical protein